MQYIPLINFNKKELVWVLSLIMASHSCQTSCEENTKKDCCAEPEIRPWLDDDFCRVVAATCACWFHWEGGWCVCGSGAGARPRWGSGRRGRGDGDIHGCGSLRAMRSLWVRAHPARSCAAWNRRHSQWRLWSRIWNEQQLSHS